MMRLAPGQRRFEGDARHKVGLLHVRTRVLRAEPVNTDETSGAAVKAHPQDQLRASVAVRPPNLEVTNRDSFLWTDCDITINMGRFGGGGWSRDVSAIAAGRVTRPPLSSFTNRSRERFNSNTHVAERISGTCDIDGRGLMFFDFTLSRERHEGVDSASRIESSIDRPREPDRWGVLPFLRFRKS